MQFPIFNLQALGISNVAWLFASALCCNAFQFLIFDIHVFHNITNDLFFCLQLQILVKKHLIVCILHLCSHKVLLSNDL
jgi:hypothetical protein